MTNELAVFFSNRLEILYEDIKNNLLNRGQAPFTRRIVIVYGPAMKSWLMLRMAADPELSVFAGIEIILLNEAFEKLSEACLPASERYLPSYTEIALAIEHEIKKIISGYGFLSPEELFVWGPLIHYLKPDENSSGKLDKLPRKIEKRIVYLSMHLAGCFREYGSYAPVLAGDWEKTEPGSGEWQQALWKKVFHPDGNRIYPCAAFKRPVLPIKNMEIHFFSISYIGRSEFQFICRLAKSIPLFYYILSPCAVFWSDIRSDRESAYLQTFWNRKLGAKSAGAIKLEELLRDRNPLAANFGRPGRESANQIEESTAIVHAKYLIPFSERDAEEDPIVHEDIYLDRKEAPLTLLEKLQTDILLLRNPDERKKADIESGDMSIQVHISPTKQREIEILYNNILGLIENDPSLKPGDITVTAPDIVSYVPYVQSIFGSKDSQLDFGIIDADLAGQNEIVRGFFQLVELSESRWDADLLLQLFEQPSFRRKNRFSGSDLSHIRQWIETAGIRWGESREHRNEVLAAGHCTNDMADDSESGTWDAGFGRLLTGLAVTIRDRRGRETDLNPCENIDFSRSELLARLFRLIHSLRDDLKPLHDQTCLSPDDWADYLHCLLEAYFQQASDDAHSKEEFESLRNLFEFFRVSARTLKDAEFSFISVKAHLKELLRQRKVAIRENRLGVVRFCSMVPLRCIPSKVVAMIGMQEEDFPRQNRDSSLNLARCNKFSDYCPSLADKDRYLFLEALQSTLHTLLISYRGYDPNDGKELQASPVVEELIGYLNSYFLIDGKSFSETRVFKHPFDSFHAGYFRNRPGFLNYSSRDFRLAQSYYDIAREGTHCFVRSFPLEKRPLCEILPDRASVDIRQLIRVASDPVAFYLNKTLDIYVKQDEIRIGKREEKLVPTYLDKYLLKRMALREPVDSVVRYADREGKLPLGLFKTVASKKIVEEAEDTRFALKKHNIEPEDIFEIEFCPNCSEPREEENGRKVIPAAVIDFSGDFKLIVEGKIPYACKKGLLTIGTGNVPDVWKAWPQFLLYRLAGLKYPGLLEDRLIPAYASKSKQAFFIDPEPYLKRFIHYYALCTTQFSPLMPDWIPLILEGKSEELHDQMLQLFSEQPFSSGSRSEGLRWILNKHCLPCSREIIDIWQEEARFLAGDLYKSWYSLKEEIVYETV